MSLQEIRTLMPGRIEEESMRIIEEEMDKERIGFYTKEELKVVKRCIHTSADFDYQYNLVFTKNAVFQGMEALKRGARIVTDTTMAAAGINKEKLAKLNVLLSCFIADEDVKEEARARRITRSACCMEKAALLAAEEERPLMIAIGNAPTALIRLDELIKEGRIKPALIIAAPVGFVNVKESKELIMQSPLPHIAARGRKGGSNIAACIVNAMLYQIA